jgi:choline dehydrogenase-like flavoprotein
MLSEAGRHTLVVEEGPIVLPEETEPFSLKEMRAKYRNGGLTMALGRPIVQYVEGRCLGGGSEINSGLHHRLPEEMVWDWSARYALTDFEPSRLEGHFEEVERDLSVSFMPEEAIIPASLRLKAGAEALGWSCVEVPRWRLYHPSDSNGERQTMTRTYLPRARRAGARILVGARVERLSPSGSGWEVIVQTLAADKASRRSVRASAVFLGAGAIGSPLILKRSGLRPMGSPGLHLHPTVKLIAQFRDQVNPPGAGVGVHQVKEFGSSMSFGCSISSPHYLAVALDSRPGGTELVQDHWPSLACYYVSIVPEGRGGISTVPGFEDPVVRFSLTKRDLAVLTLGVKRLAKLLLSVGAVRIFPTVKGLKPIRELSDVEDIPKILSAKTLELMTIHLTSANAMGGTPKLGAVDQWGAVWGRENLMVCDASILCSAPGVNPQGPLLALVRRNVAHYLEA